MANEPFRLANDRAPQRPALFDDNEQSRQRALFAGLHALPGQIDLFSVDGELSDENPPPASA
jgi:hypothetical protein